MVEYTPGDDHEIIFENHIDYHREWVSPASVTYLIHRLVETESEFTSLLDRFTLFILPLVNPDGYEYSRLHDRMWRKTRSRTGGRNLFGDVSIDINLSFPMVQYIFSNFFRNVKELI